MILFLDFDGVLHTDPCPSPDRHFEHAARLAHTLAAFPAVDIVFSTSWRHHFSVEALSQRLPPELQARVLGATPGSSLQLGVMARHPYRRQAECLAWLSDNGIPDWRWLALDDRPDGFAPYCDNLVECISHRGFDEEAAARLTGRLQLICASAPGTWRARPVDLDVGSHPSSLPLS